MSGIAKRSIAVASILEAHATISMDVNGGSRHLIYFPQTPKPVIAAFSFDVETTSSKSIVKDHTVNVNYSPTPIPVWVCDGNCSIPIDEPDR